jgi:DNA segregation ATPase FtsK/SpoIIIE, S-DNA-T family
VAAVSAPQPGHVRRELTGIVLLVFALFLAGALALGGGAHSVFGPVGFWLRFHLEKFLGMPAALVLPLIPAVHALRLFGRMGRSTDRSWLLFLVGVVVLLPLVFGLALGFAPETDHPLAGVWGGWLAYYVEQWFGPAGAWFIVALAVSALMAGTLAWNPIRVLIAPRVKRPVVAADEREPDPEEMPAIEPAVVVEEKPARKKKVAPLVKEGALELASEPAIVGPGNDELPPSDLLSLPAERNVEVSKRELDAMGAKLMDSLRTFKVDGDLVGRTTGPVVTQFEIAPASGVKVRQIANLANDLALAMRAQSIRIVAPIPGKGAVGVEVPNPVAEMVAFRDLIESREYQNSRAALPIALGKDLEGRPVIDDLAKMPHLLIAGATGSGKSVCVNTIITSLLYRHTPKKLWFLMVDPKMVELSVYNAIPHLRHKVITDNRDAAKVLKWAVYEMQRRYELLAANNCRNVQDFNRRVETGTVLVRPAAPEVAFEDRTYLDGALPYIVVVIDELADLMMTVQAEVETPLAMLAQKARAIGIHLILATQRPSVNVITGLIKANFPSRIAFRVASQVDSRTIIDGIGAESLLGNGDMLFIPPGKSEPSRLQGAYISGEDTERLLKWYSGRAEAKPTEEPDILEQVREKEALEAAVADGVPVGAGERDPYFREAAEIVIVEGGGSTSLLQRRLKIGYGRAARIIDQLHFAGVLGPPDGSKGRDVLAGIQDLDRICGPKA